jgi:putative addiction module killer protein
MTPIAVTREIRLYVAEDGRCPYKEWLEALRDIRAQARIGQRLDRLATGNPGDVKPLGEGLAELRIDYGQGYRIYFGQQGQRLVILLCGGDKASQSVDIKTARRYWADWRKRP